MNPMINNNFNKNCKIILEYENVSYPITFVTMVEMSSTEIEDWYNARITISDLNPENEEVINLLLFLGNISNYNLPVITRVYKDNIEVFMGETIREIEQYTESYGNPTTYTVILNVGLERIKNKDK